MTEAAFRDCLRTVLFAYDGLLPTALAEEVHDHLHRHDSAMRTLCFDSPLREELVGRLVTWADEHAPDVAPRLRKVYPARQDWWPGPQHYPPVEQVPAPVAASVLHQGRLF